MCRVPSRRPSVCTCSSTDWIHCLARGSHDLHDCCQCDCTRCGPHYWASGVSQLPCCYSGQWDHLHQPGMGACVPDFCHARLFTPVFAAPFAEKGGLLLFLIVYTWSYIIHILSVMSTTMLWSELILLLRQTGSRSKLLQLTV